MSVPRLSPSERIARTTILASQLLSRPLVPRGRVRTGDLLIASWFAAVTFVLIGRPILAGLQAPIGFDSIIYTDAARALLAGTDPWQVTVFGITFAAPPPSLLPYLPLTVLPDSIVGPLSVAMAGAFAIYSIRRLQLRLWWLLFPPIALGILIGSSTLLILALLVRGGLVAEAAAIVARVYAAWPLVLLGRWRSVVAAAVVIAVTAPLLGWGMFLPELGHVDSVITSQSSGGSSVTAAPLLVPLAVLFLALLGRRRAAWFLVPALWPYAQLHYASIALPALGEAPIVAFAIALPFSPALVLAGLGGQVAAERLDRWSRATVPDLANEPDASGRGSPNR